MPGREEGGGMFSPARWAGLQRTYQKLSKRSIDLGLHGQPTPTVYVFAKFMSIPRAPFI